MVTLSLFPWLESSLPMLYDILMLFNCFIFGAFSPPPSLLEPEKCVRCQSHFSGSQYQVNQPTITWTDKVAIFYLSIFRLLKKNNYLMKVRNKCSILFLRTVFYSSILPELETKSVSCAEVTWSSIFFFFTFSPLLVHFFWSYYCFKTVLIWKSLSVYSVL